MKLEYFDAHGRGCTLRMLFFKTKTPYQDLRNTMPEFFAKKPTGIYKLGQIPVLWMDDGSQYCQTRALATYIAQQSGDKTLYPGNSDPMLSYKIDSFIDWGNGELDKWNAWFLPFLPSYQNREALFTQFITKDMDVFLQKMEDTITANGGAYLFGQNFTTADAYFFGSFFVKWSENDLFEHNLILRAIISKYPKVENWTNVIRAEFKDFLSAKENQTML